MVSVGFDRLAVLISWSSEEACVSTSSAKGLWLDAALSACCWGAASDWPEGCRFEGRGLVRTWTRR